MVAKPWRSSAGAGGRSAASNVVGAGRGLWCRTPRRVGRQWSGRRCWCARRGSGHYVPYPASYPQSRRRRGRPTRPEVSCCLSATGISFSGHPIPARGLGLPHGRLTGHRPRARTLTGLPRSTHTSSGRGGCLLYPEGDGTHPADHKSSTGACRSSTAQPLCPAQTTHQRWLADNETSTEVHAIHPSSLALTCSPHGWNRDPRA